MSTCGSSYPQTYWSSISKMLSSLCSKPQTLLCIIAPISDMSTPRICLQFMGSKSEEGHWGAGKCSKIWAESLCKQWH